MLFELRDAVALRELDELALAYCTRGDQRTNVTDDLVGHTHVALDQPEHEFVGLTLAPQPRGRNAQPFLIELGRIARVAARNAAADVGHVRKRHRVAD